MDWNQVIGIVAGICTATSLLPQVIKTFKEKKAEDVSILMLVVLWIGQILWIVYGIQKKDVPIIATNAFSLLINVLMMILRFRYARR